MKGTKYLFYYKNKSTLMNTAMVNFCYHLYGTAHWHSMNAGYKLIVLVSF